MIKQIKMPSAGQTTDAALISKWMVAKGDKVKLGDILLEAETDKAVLPVESFAEGIVIELSVNEGDTVDAGDVLALIGDEKDLTEYAGTKANTDAVPQVQPSAVTGSHEDEFIPIIKGTKTAPAVSLPAEKQSSVPAMPNAKKTARENGVSLADVAPSNGQYIKNADVKLSMQAAPAAAAADYETVTMSKMRAAIGRRMLESVHTIPAFQISVQVDMTQAMSLKDAIFQAYGKKVSYNDLVAKAVAVTAKKYPFINARYESDEMRVYKHTNIGVAVATDGGLVVPVVKNADGLGILDIAAINRTNIESARKGELKFSDMGCGSVTISNLGMYDVSHFTAIVNPPESCILAISSIETKPVWENGEWKPVPLMCITGSFDHRMIDGAYGAQILKLLKNLLENPSLMLC